MKSEMDVYTLVGLFLLFLIGLTSMGLVILAYHAPW